MRRAPATQEIQSAVERIVASARDVERAVQDLVRESVRVDTVAAHQRELSGHFLALAR
jgi:hypothetical protein